MAEREVDTERETALEREAEVTTNEREVEVTMKHHPMILPHIVAEWHTEQLNSYVSCIIDGECCCDLVLFFGVLSSFLLSVSVASVADDHVAASLPQQMPPKTPLMLRL